MIELETVYLLEIVAVLSGWILGYWFAKWKYSDPQTLRGKDFVRFKEKMRLNECPQCGGYADNGHDRCFPPNVYLCKKCQESEEHF